MSFQKFSFTVPSFCEDRVKELLEEFYKKFPKVKLGVTITEVRYMRWVDQSWVDIPLVRMEVVVPETLTETRGTDIIAVHQVALNFRHEVEQIGVQWGLTNWKADVPLVLFVERVEEAIRIRTGERGDDAA